jgi:hypothetical protein
MGGDEMARAIFVPDGEFYLPTALAAGPWGPYVAGQNVGGLLCRTIERDFGDPDFQLARLTVDLPRRALLQPCAVTTTVHRDGGRVRLVDAVLAQDDTAVATARAVFLRRGEQPGNTIWSAPVSMPAIPHTPSPVPDDYPLHVWAFNSDEPDRVECDFSALQQACQKFLWMRFVVPLILGEDATPTTRAAMAADATSAICQYGTDGLHFINADYTLALSRPPDGPFVGLAAMTQCGHAGVANGGATMFDQRGPIGNCLATGIANQGFPQTNAQR